MPPRAAQRNSIRTKNTVSYTGMSSAGGIAQPTSLAKTTWKSVPSKSSKSNPKQKTQGIDGILIREGETLSKGVVRIFKLYFFSIIYKLFCSGVLDVSMVGL